jgi:hypothetical protein
VPLVHRSYRQAWRSIRRDVEEAERLGQTIIFPD